MTIKDILENLRLFKNRVRMWFLKRFTDRVKTITVKDENGQDHTITAEQQYEDVCQHKTIRQLVGTFWHCVDCPDIFFEITYKVALTRTDLLGCLEAMAQHLKNQSFDTPHDEPSK